MRCAGASVVRTYLSPVGRAHHANLYLQHLRARTSASIMGSELQPPALRSTPPRCPKPSPRCAGPRVVRTYLSPVGRAPTLCASVASSVLGASAPLMGSELQPPALRSTPPR